MNNIFSGPAGQHVVARMIHEVEAKLEITLNQFSQSYEQDEREFLCDRITAIYAALDVLKQQHKELNYIWN